MFKKCRKQDRTEKDYCSQAQRNRKTAPRRSRTDRPAVTAGYRLLRRTRPKKVKRFFPPSKAWSPKDVLGANFRLALLEGGLHPLQISRSPLDDLALGSSCLPLAGRPKRNARFFSSVPYGIVYLNARHQPIICGEAHKGSFILILEGNDW
jgi:hypothetical protein